MKHSLLLGALVAGLALAPLGALAMDDNAMSGAHAMSSAGSMMACHPTKSGETSNAQTTGSMKEALTCKPVDVKKLMAGPGTSGMSTAAQADKAWREFIQLQVNPL